MVYRGTQIRNPQETIIILFILSKLRNFEYYLLPNTLATGRMFETQIQNNYVIFQVYKVPIMLYCLRR